MKLKMLHEAFPSDYEDFEKEGWTPEDEEEFSAIESVIPVTRLPSGAFAYKSFDQGTDFGMGQYVIPRFIALGTVRGGVDYTQCDDWIPVHQTVYKFELPDLSLKSQHPISIHSWHGDSTSYPAGMPAIFRNNQYGMDLGNVGPEAGVVGEAGGELVASVPCKVIDRFEYVGDQDRDYFFENDRGGKLVWKV